MTPVSRIVLAATALLGMACIAEATNVGYSNPYGNPDATYDVGYALWDTFVDTDSGSGLGFTNVSPNTGNAGIISATYSGSMTGGMILGSGDRIYNGVAAASAAFNFTITGNVTAPAPEAIIDRLSVQIKLTSADPATGLSQLQFFTVTLNGQVATPVFVTESTGEVASGRTFGIVKYSWSDLNLTADESFTIAITSPASGHVSMDGFRIDAVPEPSTYAMILAGAGILYWVKRRRSVVA